MPNKFLNLLLLMRLNSPSVYFCYFFPAAFGLLLSYENTSYGNFYWPVADIFLLLIYFVIFALGSVIMRAAGCIISDILDRDLDGRVERTKNRPIPRGAVSVFEALLLLGLLLIFGLLLLIFFFSKTSIIVGFVSLLFITLYPLMKRITYFPQVFLGLTINFGCLIGYAAVKDELSMNALIMYFACGFWSVAYDTIYAFMDIKDDKKIGVKSTAIFFEKMNYKLIIFSQYFIFLALFVFATRGAFGWFLFVAITASLCYCVWIVKTLDINSMDSCLVRFKANNYVGLLLFLGLLLEKL